MTTPAFARRAFLVASTAAITFPGAGTSQTKERTAEGGIGGTGIVGVLAEFGSLIVSGEYIKTDDKTRFSDGFGRIHEQDLQIGHSLTIEAAGEKGDLVARRVHVTYPLVGRISFASKDGHVLIINGVGVDLDHPLRGFQVGDRVAVSGLWRDLRVVGSLLTRAQSGLDLVSGDITRVQNGRRVGGTIVQGSNLAQLPLQSFASVKGRYDPKANRFYAAQVTSQRFNGAAGALKRLAVEGYLHPSSEAPGFRVSGLGHSFRRTLQLDQYQNQRVLFEGPYTGRFDARNAVVLPDDPAARTDVIRDLSR